MEIEKESPFKDLSKPLKQFVRQEVNGSFECTLMERLVVDESGSTVGGYHLKYYEPQINQDIIELKGYWVPTEEGNFYSVDDEVCSALVREGEGTKEVLFLVHPDSTSYFSPLIEKYQHREVKISALPLSSFRTVLVAIPFEGKYRYEMVKTSLDREIGGTNRILSWKECACSVGSTAALENRSLPLTLFKDDFAFIPHPHLVRENPEKRGGGLIHRKIPDFFFRSKKERQIIPLFALFSQDGKILKALFKKSHLTPTAFVKSQFLDKLASIIVEMIFHHQTSLEIHAQNLVLVIEEDEILEIAYRDMGGVNSLLTSEQKSCLPEGLQGEECYYQESHFQDAALALERFVITVLFEFTRYFLLSEEYLSKDHELRDWKIKMENGGFIDNWRLPENKEGEIFRRHFLPEEFYRYGYFEKIFAFSILNQMTNQGVFKTLLGDDEKKGAQFFAEKIGEEPSTYQSCLNIEWFYYLILNTYPEYVAIHKHTHNLGLCQSQRPTSNPIEVAPPRKSGSASKKEMADQSPDKRYCRPFATSSPDLFKDDVSCLKRRLDQLKSLTPFTSALKTQLENSLRHLDLSFEIVDPRYSHSPVWTGPFPFGSTQAILLRGQDFLSVVEEENMPDEDEYPRNIDDRIEDLLKEHRKEVRRIVEAPLYYYRLFRHRLESKGCNAPFGEFMTLIDFLILSMCMAKAKSKEIACKQLCQRVIQCLIDLREKSCPYLDTIHGVEYALGVLDGIERSFLGKDKSPKPFHSVQYEYYSSYLKGEVPRHILFPVFCDIGATDMLKICGVPLGFVGVNVKSAWVDAFLQTPLEFWYHDINHTRKMWQFYQEEAVKEKSSLDEFIEKADRYVQEELLPLFTFQIEDENEVRHKKQMVKMILFEILHEFSMAPSSKTIETLLTAPCGFLTNMESIEGNHVKYSMGPCGTVLAIVHWKLAAHFYDTIDNRNHFIVPEKYRTKENAVDAARYIVEKLSLSPVRDEVLWQRVNE
jgi:hypothetical protein